VTKDILLTELVFDCGQRDVQYAITDSVSESASPKQMCQSCEQMTNQTRKRLPPIIVKLRRNSGCDG